MKKKQKQNRKQGKRGRGNVAALEELGTVGFSFVEAARRMGIARVSLSYRIRRGLTAAVWKDGRRWIPDSEIARYLAGPPPESMVPCWQVEVKFPIVYEGRQLPPLHFQAYSREGAVSLLSLFEDCGSVTFSKGRINALALPRIKQKEEEQGRDVV